MTGTEVAVIVAEGLAEEEPLAVELPEPDGEPLAVSLGLQDPVASVEPPLGSPDSAMLAHEAIVTLTPIAAIVTAMLRRK